VQCRPHVGRETAAGEHLKPCGQIGGDNRPARRRDPARGTLDEQFRDLGRLERRVQRANDVLQRVVAFDMPAQLTLKHAQARREVEARGRERQFTGTTRLGSALADGGHRWVRRAA
jgi:hypothetical protein